ncbi:hypothetical protein VTI28DRAFT_5734 [Corynascus sepedonium]
MLVSQYGRKNDGGRLPSTSVFHAIGGWTRGWTKKAKAASAGRPTQGSASCPLDLLRWLQMPKSSNHCSQLYSCAPQCPSAFECNASSAPLDPPFGLGARAHGLHYYFPSQIPPVDGTLWNDPHERAGSSDRVSRCNADRGFLSPFRGRISTSTARRLHCFGTLRS